MTSAPAPTQRDAPIPQYQSIAPIPIKGPPIQTISPAAWFCRIDTTTYRGEMSCFAFCSWAGVSKYRVHYLQEQHKLQAFLRWIYHRTRHMDYQWRQQDQHQHNDSCSEWRGKEHSRSERFEKYESQWHDELKNNSRVYVQCQQSRQRRRLQPQQPLLLWKFQPRQSYSHLQEPTEPWQNGGHDELYLCDVQDVYDLILTEANGPVYTWTVVPVCTNNPAPTQ